MRHEKVAFIGLPAVGKTSIITLLSENRTVTNYEQTIGISFGFVTLGECEVSLFDIAGQDRFRFLWNGFMRGAKVIFVVTDSTPVNVLNTRKIIEEFCNKPNTIVLAIANKQDLPGAMKPSQVEDLLNVKTYGMVAIDPRKRTKMCHILRDALEQIIIERSN
ncbi:MAG: ADP-ribosylation factor-like protein [Candidatus Freyarchaeota archaeon]|jgi:small GTP-binding protein|nr:GTP-binding protein [Candidatus Jordarchaeia archaeon]MBS7269659.1 GTP-binding protein [Candidatus Jordarchaeia archaeon]MBS7279687.1 GTP-binding protein [Candidatus Jordarchaeia archaeon]